MRLVKDTISFNDGEWVAINGENVVGVAADVCKTEAISLTLRNGDDRERSGGVTSPTTETVDQS